MVCFSCGLVIKEWPENESIAQIHRRLSPFCEYVREIENHTYGEDREDANATFFEEAGSKVHTRIKIREKEEDESLPVPNLGPIDGSVASMSVTERETEQFLSLHPIYTIYKEKAERLNTFRIWTFGDIVKPKMLADAGFFYLGNSIITSKFKMTFLYNLSDYFFLICFSLFGKCIKIEINFRSIT